MPTREEVLREKTHKGNVEEIEKRIYYTLTGEESLKVHRIAKGFALLVKDLNDKGLISDENIDDILFEVIS